MKAMKMQRMNMPRLLAPSALLVACLWMHSSQGIAAEATQEAKPSSAAAQSLPADADKAWAQVEKASEPPLPPASWNQQKPSQEEYAAFKLKMGQAAAVAADRAKEFYQRWPDHARTAEAKSRQRKMLAAAVQLGVTDREAELRALPAATDPAPAAVAAADKQDDKSDSSAPAGEDAEYIRRVREAITKAQRLQGQGMEAMVLDYEKSLRALNKEFPDRPQYFAGLLEVAQLISGDKALQLTREIAASPKAPPQAKEMAQTMLKSLERQGKPLDIKFKAVDGRDVDLTKLKGKVVLVDFWATWCGPCRVEIPNVLAAYQRLNPKGFEIVGISFDDDKEALEEFTKKNKMPWVQYFDGQGWGNKLGREFGISGVPTMWLVDKKGNLRDLNGRTDLASKVEKLLAED